MVVGNTFGNNSQNTKTHYIINNWLNKAKETKLLPKLLPSYRQVVANCHRQGGYVIAPWQQVWQQVLASIFCLLNYIFFSSFFAKFFCIHKLKEEFNYEKC